MRETAATPAQLAQSRNPQKLVPHECNTHCDKDARRHAFTIHATPGITADQILATFPQPLFIYDFGGGMARLVDVRPAPEVPPLDVFDRMRGFESEPFDEYYQNGWVTIWELIGDHAGYVNPGHVAP